MKRLAFILFGIGLVVLTAAFRPSNVHAKFCGYTPIFGCPCQGNSELSQADCNVSGPNYGSPATCNANHCTPPPPPPPAY